MISRQSVAVPRGDAMAPPELARDAPVADVVHPIVVSLDPVLRDELDAAIVHRLDGLLGQRLRLDEPLRGDQRLDDGLAAIAVAQVELVVLDLFQQAERSRSSPRACGLRSDRGRRRGRPRRSCFATSSITLIVRQVVALAGLEIVRIVRGRHLHHAGAELGIGEFVQDDRDLAIHQRQRHRAAVQIAVALVAGLIATAVSPSMVSGRVVATVRKRPARRHRIADVPQVPSISSCATSRSERRCGSAGTS